MICRILCPADAYYDPTDATNCLACANVLTDELDFTNCQACYEIDGIVGGPLQCTFCGYTF